MIFAAVGTQLPFPRLVAALDNIAYRRSLDVIAQTADASANTRAITSIPFMTTSVFEEHLCRASMIVGHAGVGLILLAAQHNKPIIVFPRSAQLAEHRNEHQNDTAIRLSGKLGMAVAHDEVELEALIFGEVRRMMVGASASYDALVSELGAAIEA